MQDGRRNFAGWYRSAHHIGFGGHDIGTIAPTLPAVAESAHLVDKALVRGAGFASAMDARPAQLAPHRTVRVVFGLLDQVSPTVGVVDRHVPAMFATRPDERDIWNRNDTNPDSLATIKALENARH